MVGAIGLLAAGVRVGHTGGQLVYTHGAASAYASGAATTGEEGSGDRMTRDGRGTHDDGSE